MKKYAVMLVALALPAVLSGCFTPGPEKPLKEMSTALNKKDPTLFLSQMDGKRFAQAEINNYTQSNEPLRALDSVGKMLGLGGMDALLGSVMNMQMRQEEKFTRGVSTGELMLQCRSATAPDCPWVPDSLQNAKIKEISPVAAVAQVTTPANITSWLALSKVGEVWKVVGQAPLEAMAVRYAEGKMDGAPSTVSPEKGSPKTDRPAPPPTSPAPAPQKDRPAPPPAPTPEKPQAPVRL